MKRWLFTTVLIVGLIAAWSLATAEEAAAHVLDGQWDMYFEWAGANAKEDGSVGEEQGHVVWTIRMYSSAFGTFQSSSGAYGYILYIQSSNVFLALYATGCRPVYFSRNFDGIGWMSGFMFCRDGAGWGTWEAFKQG